MSRFDFARSSVSTLLAGSAILFLMSASTAPAQPAAASSASGATSKPLLATPLRWKSTGVLIEPVSDVTHDLVSIRDPTLVRYKDKWHVFATTANSRGNWSMVYLSFADWADAIHAKPYYINNNPNLREHECVPQVFYFRPQRKWYLIFQSETPQYSTTDDLSKPETWTKPERFFATEPPGAAPRWIDFWVICDDTHAYLFFTANDGCMYRSRTTIKDFPSGMSNPEIALQGRRNDVVEGGMTYKIKGTDTYLTLIESYGPDWYYRAWTADHLDGAWTPLANADSFEKPFAGINNVTFADGVTPWTRDISHGELIRDGYDETLTIDLNNLELLYQDRDPEVSRPYNPPYRLGLLKLDRSKQ